MLAVGQWQTRCSSVGLCSLHAGRLTNQQGVCTASLVEASTGMTSNYQGGTVNSTLCQAGHELAMRAWLGSTIACQAACLDAT